MGESDFGDVGKVAVSRNGRSLALIASLISIVAGVSLVQTPVLGFLLLAVVGAVVLLTQPPYVWATGAVLLAVFSRLIVSTGFVPSVANFFHFIFVLGGVLLVLWQQMHDPPSPLARSLGIGLVGLLAVSLLSWTMNGGDLVKPWLTWLVLAEPFLLCYILLRDPRAARVSQRLWTVVLMAAFVQVPLTLWQATLYGIGDAAAGTFVGGGGGAHGAGAVALIGVLLLVSRYLFGGRLNRSRVIDVVGIILLLIVPIISDANAVLGVFIMGGFLLVAWSSVKASTFRSVWMAILAGAIILAGLQVHPGLSIMYRYDLVPVIVEQKLQSLEMLSLNASESPHAWVIGFGPGNSFSKVALMSYEDRVRADSPVRLLGLNPSSLTTEAVARYRRFSLGSSVWQPWFSWVGVLGDLGLLGLALYVWLWWVLWRKVRLTEGWSGYYGSALILVTVLMGFYYDWLEEPGYALVVALALSLVQCEQDDEPQLSAGGIRDRRTRPR